MATQFKLLPGEEMAFEIECDMIQTVNNPIAIKIAQLMATIAKVFGTTNRVKLIVTNKRVVLIAKSVYCWCIPDSSVHKIIMPHSVKEVGYASTATCFGLIKSYILYFQGLTDSNIFVMKGVEDEQLAEYVSKFYAALNA